MLSIKQGASSTIFLVFGVTRPGIEPRSPGPLAHTLLIRLMARCIVKTKMIHALIAESNKKSTLVLGFLKNGVWIVQDNECKDKGIG